jgi:iron-sulfur cluster repair protein YtfE (RIC family)
MRGDHDDLDDLEKAMDEAIEANDIDQIRKAFAAFKSENEAHLQKEEGIMMPKVMGMKKAVVDMKDMMVNEC